jgi:GDP-4-dehydro-6-deoxy-D-mannose reductase
LITGCGGFIGSHLADFLLDKGLAGFGTDRQFNDALRHKKELTLFQCDIMDKKTLEEVIHKVQPDLVFHLAAQSLVMPSWKDPEFTFRINTFGTLYLLDSIRSVKINPIIIVAGSSAEYGTSQPDEIPIKETKELRPTSPYGVSKVAEDMLAYLYWNTYGMKIIRVRPFFIIGPRKESDVASSFACGIAEIETGKRENLSVGNLETVRDFIDYRDAIKALWLLTAKGTAGDVYNVCSGKGYRIKEILDKLLKLTVKPIEICNDPELMRPSDDPVVIGDNSRLLSLGWKPEIPIEKTLADILDYWRHRITKQESIK